MRKQTEKTGIVRKNFEQLVDDSTSKCYGKLTIEQETELLHEIAKAMQVPVSQEEIREAVEQFKKSEPATER